MTPVGGHHDPVKGVTMTPEVHKVSSQPSTQGSTQDKSATLEGAMPPLSNATQSLPVSDAAEKTGSNPHTPTATQPTSSHIPGNTPKHDSITNDNTAITPAKVSKARGPLTDAQLIQIKGDITSHAGYWLYGPATAGLTREQWNGMTPSKTNWSTTTLNFSKPEADCSISAFAAYAWYRIQCTRNSVNQSLELPAFPKLCGVIKSLLTRMTRAEIIAQVDTLATQWPKIVAALSWMSSPPTLDETILTNGKVKEVIDRINRGENVTPPTANKPAITMTDADSINFVNITNRQSHKNRL